MAMRMGQHGPIRMARMARTSGGSTNGHVAGATGVMAIKIKVAMRMGQNGPEEKWAMENGQDGHKDGQNGKKKVGE